MLIPPLIRESLLDDEQFREESGIKTEAMISFGKGSISVRSSEFFAAVRTIFSGKSPMILADAEGQTWNLTNKACDGEVPKLALSLGQDQIDLPDFAILSETTSMRIRSIEDLASELNIPVDTQDKWKRILELRALENDEVDEFLSDMRDTPTIMARTIGNEMKTGKSSLPSLVPHSRRYYDRLVGSYDGSLSIHDYATKAGRLHIKQLLEWLPFEGLLFSLLLSSHSALTDEIDVSHLNREKLVEAFDFIEKHGDILSQLGALEIGLRILPKLPEIEPFLKDIICKLRDDDVKGNPSEFKLFSALFILVDGELAKTRLMAETPPFYRRLASMAQAALIHRQLVHHRIDSQEFLDQAYKNRGEHFYMQSLADMRIEPLWNPALASAPQMQSDFFGRILIAGKKYEANVVDSALREVIFGNGEQCLMKRCEFPFPFLPGPLEGGENSPNVLPDDLAEIIEQDLDKEEVEASSFVALVNSALIFRITSGQAELAARALTLGNHTLSSLKDKSHLVGILTGLATVAAVSRNSTLADEVRILLRRYRRDSQYGLSIEEAMMTCLLASAAHEDLMKWRKYVGDCLTELAFSDFKDDEGEEFHSHLLALLHSVPELWVSCARAEAALRAWRFR